MAERPIALVSDVDNPFGAASADALEADGLTVVRNSPSGSHPRHDLASPLTTRTMVQSAAAVLARRVGAVSVLIHTHRLVTRATVTDCDPDTFDQALAVNLDSAFWLTQVFGQAMAQSGAGVILYLSSIHDEKPTGSAFPYSVAHGALKMLNREAALELGRFGVRVNLIELGAMEGDDRAFASDLSGLYRRFPDKVPGGRAGAPEDAAYAVRMLVDGRARHINGAEIRVDGGFLLHYQDGKIRAHRKEMP